MHCPKCKVNAGNIEFCEHCGSETIANLNSMENNKSETLKLGNSKQKEFKIPKISFKKGLQIFSIAAITISLVFGYKSVKKYSSPNSTVERYVNYLVADDYEKAFNMLEVNANNKLLNKDNFSKYIATLNLENAEIRDIIPTAGFYNLFNELENNKQYGDDIMFCEVELDNEIFILSVIKEKKKFGLINSWKIVPMDFIKELRITVPGGAKVLVDNEELENYEEIIDTQMFFSDNDLYNIKTWIYTVNVFPGEYEITTLMPGANDINMKVNYNENPKIALEANNDLINELKEISETFINKFYSNHDKKEYESIVHLDSEFFNEDDLFNSFSPKYDYMELKNLDVIESQIDSVDHMKLIVKSDFYYETKEVIDWFTDETKLVTNNDSEKFEFFFIRINDKWLITNIKSLY